CVVLPYFDIAMIIPQCSHNCECLWSRFIQCCLSDTTVTEPELRNNRLLDELVKCFRSVRYEHLLSGGVGGWEAPRTVISRGRPFRRVGISSLRSMYHNNDTKKNHSLIPIAARTASVSSDNTALPSESIALCTEAPSTSSLAAKVQCPICSVDISEANINRHLDNCLAREDKIESLRSTTMKRKLMPKVVYNLLSDRDLKKRLKECGLSSQGTKAQLIKRHQAFVQMYNAQCDSLNPQSGNDSEPGRRGGSDHKHGRTGRFSGGT
uniref:RING-type E3 ubiquitin transferase n=1 Tax=Callorhinchus milii TaxID=7868 RepID=A0A4W3KA61_CALMI